MSYHIVCAAAGGAMIGVPAGRAAGGDSQPPWALAGGGAGLFVGGIILAAVSPLILDQAVNEHNKRFGKPTPPGAGAVTRALQLPRNVEPGASAVRPQRRSH